MTKPIVCEFECQITRSTRLKLTWAIKEIITAWKMVIK